MHKENGLDFEFQATHESIAQNIPNTRTAANESIASAFNILLRVIPEAALVFVVGVGACVEAAVFNGVEDGVEVIKGFKSGTTALVLTAAGV